MGFLDDIFGERKAMGPGASYGTSTFVPSVHLPPIELPDIAPPHVTPGNMMQEGFNRMTAPLGPVEGIGDIIQGVGNRLGGALEAGAGLLGKPQEMATQAIFGEQFHRPSEVPELQQIFSMNGTIPASIAGFAADIALDPLNLAFGAGAIPDLFKGAVTGAKMIDSAENLKQLAMLSKGGDGLFFKSLDDLHKLQRAAGTSLPAKFDEVTGFYTYDLNKSFSLNVGKDVEKLREASKGFHVEDIEALADHHFLGSSTKGWSEKELSIFQKVFGNPRFHGDFTKASVRTLTDGSKARTGMIQGFKEEAQALLPNIPFKGTENPLSRGFMYTLFGEEKALAKDAGARAAIEHYGPELLKEHAKAYKNLVVKYAKMAPNVKLGEETTIGLALKSLGYDAKESHIIPHDLKKIFGRGDSLNPLTADLLEMNNAFILKASKSAYVDPAIEAVENLMAKNADKLKLSEKEWISAIVRNQKGVPDPGDKLLVSHVLNSKATYRKYVWGEELVEAGKLPDGTPNPRAGELKEGIDYSALTGSRAKIGRSLERFIGRAERHEALGRETIGNIRSHVYSSLLGGAVDSAVRNLTQNFNLLTEVGMRQTLESIGTQLFNPRWKEYLKTENVVDRTQSYLSSIFEDQVFEGRSSFISKLLSPMEIVENFNRGVAYHAGLKKNLQAGMKFADASLEAEDFVRKLHFGYSNLDISPYLDNSYAKLFTQFMVYPIRQTELLFKWATEGSGLRNKAVRYLALTGGAVSYGQHLGFDMSHVLGVGLGFSQYPQHVRWELSEGVLFNPASMAVPAAARAIADVAAGVPPLLRAIFSSDPNAWGQTKDQGWKALTSAIRIGVPGGRYSLKASKDALEYIAMHDPQVYRAVQSGSLPGAGWAEGIKDSFLYKYAKLSGVDIDPGVNAQDRLVRLLGFTSTHDRARREEREFVGNFIKEYKHAISDLNDTVLAGGDVSKRQQYWLRRIRKNLGGKMAEMGVPDHIIMNQLKPSPTAVLRKKWGNSSKTSNDVLINSMPKSVKELINLQKEYW